ncbi:hypothetical protein MMAD_53760 [Mycolicibacterium madagascariense]|uniref:ESX-1 secretion-associated protein EspD n=1 Tax=Mycolicibacterium madagascariense TaxID=212765 RepID=A0A7I7XP95_9MYCO|nr:YbaB/EbfC family DNA-binding protein [Mycolicibacterium madagascariense]MCV7014056.1 YbaB/EbfC family DNA-binding protein [Mycolicibacterium madagascariense]BBZ31081.1 hypothetical protein MMAD_53760 [Mycolicibacterium madagascariense]
MDDTPPPDDTLDGDREARADLAFTVANPPATVTVSACADGRIRHVDLAQRVAAMGEADLADEIVAIAELATRHALAAQYMGVLDGMTEEGHDAATTRDFLARDLGLPSPAEAVAAQARVFAARYGDGHD